MSISGFIKQQKESFMKQKTAIEKRRIMADTERLRMERARQAELARANAERAVLEKDVRNIQQFNEKHPTPPSKLQKLGQGLASAMNKVKTDVKGAKSQGYFKGIDMGAPQKLRTPVSSGSSQNFGGQRNLEFGASSGSPFSESPRRKK